ncbi:NADPH:quinone oxidoreductase family protein [Rhizorhabdus sp. FW153]
MRALICESWGLPEDLCVREIPPPIADGPNVQIDVRAATVNFADILMIAGRYQTRPDLPFTPGLDAAGVVRTAPPGSSLRTGDRVVAILWHGGFAEQTCAADAETFPIPDAMPFDTAAVLASSYVSAGLALVDVARLQAGETMLVLGAGGGAGVAAVQIAKALGARVVALAGTPEKRALAAQAGADLVVPSTAADWRDQVGAFVGDRGADVCFDPVGGARSSEALSMLGWGGRHIVFGFAAGEVPVVPANRLLVKNRAMLGVSLRYFRRYRADRLHAMMAQLFDWWWAGLIAPVVTRRYSLERAAEALSDLAAGRAAGKLVITIGAPDQ